MNPLSLEDKDIPWHYGDPLIEQKQTFTSGGQIDRSNRGFIRLQGVNTLSWLNQLCTHNIANLLPNQTREALILNANGRAVFQFNITNIDNIIWLDSEPWLIKKLYEYLLKMRFWNEIEIKLISNLATLTLIGPLLNKLEITKILGVSFPLSPYRSGIFQIKNSPDLSGWWRTLPKQIPAVDLILPINQLKILAHKLITSGFYPTGYWTYEVLRIISLQARIDIDTDSKTLPAETNWFNPESIFSPVQLNKGCYPGQETVSKIYHTGKPPRQMYLLQIDGDTSVNLTPGIDIFLREKIIGRLGSIAWHYEYGLIALALIKTSVDLTETFNIAGINALIDPDSILAPPKPSPGRAALKKWKATRLKNTTDPTS